MRTIIAFAALIAVSSGSAVKWTGIVNNQQWNTPNNWYPARVPGVNDDVTIDDAEGKDATVVIVTPISIGSLSMGDSTNKVHLRVLHHLTVARDLNVRTNGNMEINSGAANVTCNDVKVTGEFNFLAGSLTGTFSLTGVTNFGTQAAKVFSSAKVVVDTTTTLTASGDLQFRDSSKVTTTTGLVTTGRNLQCIVMDKSVGNSFTAKGFSWKN